MKLILNIDRKAAIQAGNDLWGAVKGEVLASDVPQHLREELGTVHEDQDGYLRLDLPIGGAKNASDPACPVHHELSAEAVIATLEWRIAVRKHREQEKRETHESLVQKALEIEPKEWVRYRQNPASLAGLSNRRPPSEVSPEDHLELLPSPRGVVGDDERVKARRAEIERDYWPVACEKWLAQYTRAYEEQEEKARREQEQRAAIREWVKAHGSRRLQLMVEMGQGDWETLASREYMDQQAPEGFSYGSHDGEERRKPTLEELEAFKELQQLVAEAKGRLKDPTLDWVVQGDYYDEGEYFPERRFAALEVKVVGLNGTSAWYHKDLLT